MKLQLGITTELKRRLIEGDFDNDGQGPYGLKVYVESAFVKHAEITISVCDKRGTDLHMLFSGIVAQGDSVTLMDLKKGFELSIS